MNKEIMIRTSKFPFIFWSFNKAYKCELDWQKLKYKNIEKNTEYNFKPFNKYLFLFLKYIPIILIFYFCFNKNDFAFEKNTIISYIFACVLTTSFIFLENFTRKITNIAILIFVIGIGFYLNNLFLIAYTLKYFLFISLILLFFLDTRFQSFSIISNNKIISHFLINKKILEKE